MTAGEFAFTPRVGRIRSSGGYSRGRSFLARVNRAVSRAGPKSSKSKNVPGGRPYTGTRRVIVKARIVKMTGSSAAALAQHLRYIARDSAVREQDRGELFNGESDTVDRADFGKRASGDRHHFRLIVSPEDGAEMADLKPFIRDLVQNMERDLGTRLDWAAAIHHDTAHPHAHLVIRGRRQDGKDLVMPRRYISHGIRERASDLVSLELGPETRLERDRKRASEVRHERLTRIDRSLIRMAGDDGVLTLDKSPWQYRPTNTARLRILEKMKLATSLGSGRWQLENDLATRLKELGERGDIIKALNKAQRVVPGRQIAPDFDLKVGDRIHGRVVSVGTRGDFHDQIAATLDAEGGRLLQASLPEDLPLRAGMIAEVSRVAGAIRPSDRTIAEIARANGGMYSPALHQAADPGASVQFITAHVRRLEAMRRLGHALRTKDGNWIVPDDYLARVDIHEAERAASRPLQVRVASYLTLEDQIGNEGLAWLDGQGLSSAHGHGFEAEMLKAKQARQRELLRRGLIRSSGEQLSSEKREALRRAGLDTAAQSIAEKIGKTAMAAPERGQVSGRFTGTVDTGDGRYAVLETRQRFTLVRWRSVMEQARGREISGLVRGGHVSWTLTSGRTQGRWR